MKDYTGKWISFALEDLYSARVLLREQINNQVCFHSQQSAEKFLKALIEEKHKVPKEHSLPKLLNICKKLGYQLDPFRERLEFLDKFYTSTRYPFIIGMLPERNPSREEAERSLKIAEELYDFVNKII